MESPRRESTLTIPSIEKRRKIYMRFIELLLNSPSPKSSSSSSSRDGRILDRCIAWSIKKKNTCRLFARQVCLNINEIINARNMERRIQLSALCLIKSRIRATVSSNLSSSSSNLTLFGTVIRLSKQINLCRDCIRFEERKTRV